jgi:hypothetical protein
MVAIAVTSRSASFYLVSHLSLDLCRGSPMTALGIELISCTTHLTLKAASRLERGFL